MPSPFPGMNPYFEQPELWREFHNAYIPALRDVLTPLVRQRGYAVRIDETITIRDAWAESDAPAGRTDLAVGTRFDGPAGASSSAAAVAVPSGPVVGELPAVIDVERLPYLEVIDRVRRQVVTVIELLSPSNKQPGRDRDAYLLKRAGLLGADVNYVEIDLRRAGRRPPVNGVPPGCAYLVMVSRPADRPRVELWPLGLRDRLPEIPVPLRAGEAAPVVDLQAVLHHVYDAADYAGDVYDFPLAPPLSAADAEWAAGVPFGGRVAMPSPFPGMNPYLERPDRWRSVHNAFLFALQAAIVPAVVPRYAVEYEEALYIDAPGDDGRAFAVADVAVSRGRRRRVPASGAAVATALAPATTVLSDGVERRHRRLTIRDARDKTVVTVIELLSPSNKWPGHGRERYLAKRWRVLRSTAHLVEIDLLRGGPRLPAADLPPCDYCVIVSRRHGRPDAGVWPVGLRDDLPAIPIPLRPGDPEPLIPLKPVLDTVYDGGGYAFKIYDHPPDPPLSAADAEWAAQFLPR